MDGRMYVHVYVRTYVCMYVCMYVYFLFPSFLSPLLLCLPAISTILLLHYIVYSILHKIEDSWYTPQKETKMAKKTVAALSNK